MEESSSGFIFKGRFALLSSMNAKAIPTFEVIFPIYEMIHSAILYIHFIVGTDSQKYEFSFEFKPYIGMNLYTKQSSERVK